MKNKWQGGWGAIVLWFFVCGNLFADTDSPCQTSLGKIRGTVQVRKEGGAWQPAVSGMILGEMYEIQTDPEAFAEIFLDEDGKTIGSLELKEKSHLRITELKRDPQSGETTALLDLALGKVLAHAEKFEKKSQFEVRTPTSVTGVRGTVFEVSVEKR